VVVSPVVAPVIPAVVNTVDRARGLREGNNRGCAACGGGSRERRRGTAGGDQSDRQPGSDQYVSGEAHDDPFTEAMPGARPGLPPATSFEPCHDFVSRAGTFHSSGGLRGPALNPS
jgi:hypothetical protein